MKSILFIHDLKDNKLNALKGVGAEHFGMHGFNLCALKNKTEKETPKSFDELTKRVDERIQRLITEFDPSTKNQYDEVYYSTLQKGFLEIKQGGWLFTSYAVFGKISRLVPGMSESVPLDSDMNQFMHLPKEERYEKFTEIYSLYKVKPLISCINETSEVDWYKQAFRNCVPFGK